MSGGLDSPGMLRAISYDVARQVLEIRLQDGRIYRYARIPRMIYHALLTSASPETYFQRHIKDRYDIQRTS